MKLILSILIVFFIVSCSTQKVSVYEETKLLQMRCDIGEGTLDTFNDEYSQPAHGKVYTTQFYFSKGEQNRLIEEIKRVDFMNLPDTLKPKTFLKDELESINTFITINECEIEYKEKVKKVYCSDEDNNIYDSEEYKRFQAFLKIIYEIVRSRQEIQELPRNIYY
jgi:hypothetical protein